MNGFKFFLVGWIIGSLVGIFLFPHSFIPGVSGIIAGIIFGLIHVVQWLICDDQGDDE